MMPARTAPTTTRTAKLSKPGTMKFGSPMPNMVPNRTPAAMPPRPPVKAPFPKPKRPSPGMIAGKRPQSALQTFGR